MSQHASAHAARSHKLRNTLLVITALLILLVIAGGVVGLNFYKQAKEVKAHEEQAVSSLSAVTDINTLKDAQASDALITLLPGESATILVRHEGETLDAAALSDSRVLRSANQLVTR